MSGTGSIGRSVVAVLGGIVAGAVLSEGTDFVLRMVGVFPPREQVQPMSDGLFLLATVYRCFFSVVGCYVAAWLAFHKPMKHALITGGVGLVLCVVGIMASWNHVPSLGPHWYPVALAVTAMPCAWLGGKLREIQIGSA